MVFGSLSVMLIALSWYLSSQPGIDLPANLFRHQDKLLHIGFFSLLGFLLAGALQRDALDTRWTVALAATALAGLYGVIDELHQGFVPGRDVSVLDALADVTGGLLGALSMRWHALRS